MTIGHVVIINDMCIARGGATALAVLSAELLRKRGLRVTFVSGDDGDNPDLRALGVEIIAAGGRELLKQSALKSARSGLDNPVTRSLIADVIARHDSPETIYHVHGWGQILSPGIFAPLRTVAKRTFIHSHDFFLACPNGVYFDFHHGVDCHRKPLGAACALTHCDKRSYLHKAWRLARHVHFRRLFDQSAPWAGIILIHPKMVPQMALADYPADRLKVVRNPALPFSPSRISAEKNHGFAFVGRIEPDKGILELTAAAAKAGVGLTVIGDGPLRNDLARTYPQFAFPGWKTRAEIGALLQKTRALVMPSRFREPFGLVAVEASQSGLPVVLPGSAFLADEISENQLGYVCDVHAPDAFADLLAQVDVTEPDDIREMSMRGFDRSVPLGLSEEAWIDAQIALYEGALGSGR